MGPGSAVQLFGTSSTATMRGREDDPLSAFTKPPRNETPAQRAQRLAKEEEARKINDAIDENLKAEKIALKKQRYIVRVLLLGQSGSGVYSSFFHHVLLISSLLQANPLL